VVTTAATVTRGSRIARWRNSRLPFWLLAALHLAGSLYYFPPREILSGEPVLTGDYVQHYFESVRRADAIREGAVLTYCTTWSAGFVDGFIGLVSNKPFNAVVALLPKPWRALGFNLAVLIALWLYPPLVYLAARRFGHSRLPAALAMGLATACWYGSTMFRVFWRGGSVLFLVGTGVALWASAIVFQRWFSEPKDRPTLASAVLAIAFVPWVHAGAAVIVAVIVFTAYVASLRSRGVRLAEVALLGAATVLVNLPWLWPWIEFGDLRRPLYHGLYVGGLDELFHDFVRGPLHLGQAPGKETAVLAPLLLLAVVAAPALRRRLGLLPTLVASSAIFLVLAYGGPPLGRGIGGLQPYRFVFPLAAILAIVATAGDPWRGHVRRAARIAVRCLTVVALLLLADRLRLGFRGGDYLGAGLGPTETWALEAMRAAAAPHGEHVEGRILLEGDFFADAVPHRRSARRVSYSFVGFEGKLDAEFIGAPTMPVLTPSVAASFWLGKLFGRDLTTYSHEDFRRVADAYDIRWAVTIRARSKEKLASLAPLLELVTERGPIGIFRVHRDGGAPIARADGRRIRISATAGPAVVIPYHWNRLLAASPAGALRPVPTGVTPELSFIEVSRATSPRTTIGLRAR
jgi:hypothetical protein